MLQRITGTGIKDGSRETGSGDDNGFGRSRSTDVKK